jgi:hypothetical protein
MPQHMVEQLMAGLQMESLFTRKFIFSWAANFAWKRGRYSAAAPVRAIASERMRVINSGYSSPS